jgi:hypothetical protein
MNGLKCMKVILKTTGKESSWFGAKAPDDYKNFLSPKTELFKTLKEHI